MLAPSIIPHSHANAMSFCQRGVHFSRRCRCRGPPSSPSHPLRLVAGARAPHWPGTRRPLPLLPTTSANNISLLSSVATKDDADGNHGAASVSETTVGETEALLGSRSAQSSPQGNTTCHLPEPLIAQDAPLPPPLPDPNFSFRGRVLPPNLLAFNSAKGKERFGDSLRTDNAEAFFPLSQQFLNQSDPAYCGVSTLVLVLNALAMDPNVRWRGGWRWYGDESMLLERCCLEEERVSREGVTIEQFCGLARCQGVRLVMKRPVELEKSQQNDSDDIRKEEDDGGAGNDDNGNIERYDVADFRRDIIKAVQNPPHTHWTDALNEESDSHLELLNAETTDSYFLVTSFARHALQQTGDGHFSPIAAYHPTTDSCLVLDVARFKYTPYWVSVEELYDAMKPPDKATGKSRGWILMYPPLTPDRSKGKDPAKPRSKEELEGKRPATCVPLAGSGVLLCPVEKIKVDYCSHR